jgi:hypothetical protein
MSDRDPTPDPPAVPLVRPYMATAHRDRPASEPTDVAILRPYLLTSGRAGPVDDTLEIEAQVIASPLGFASHQRLRFEHRDIVACCTTAVSVAEIAARLGYHIGVARVLVADLAASGHVTVYRPGSRSAWDLTTIERVIRGLEAIG